MASNDKHDEKDRKPRSYPHSSGDRNKSPIGERERKTFEGGIQRDDAPQPDADRGRHRSSGRR